MKRNSLLLLAGLLLEPVWALGSNGYPRAQAFPELFSEADPPADFVLAPGTLRLTPEEIDRLILPTAGDVRHFPSIDRFTGNEASPLQFRQIELFADGARIRIVGIGRDSEVLQPQRQYYLASNTGTGIGLAVDPVSGEVSGFVARGGDRLVIKGEFVTELQFAELAETDEASATCSNDEHDVSPGSPGPEDSPQAASLSAAAAGDVISYQAVVAIETDTEWLNGFGDDFEAAMEWITDLFLAMNVFYERDVETRLLIGDVTLRICTGDPYSVQNDRFAQLSEFGEYWMQNMSHVDRQFAAMLSGRNISQWGFSGVAWIDSYCEYGHWYGGDVAGSYSYNAIGSSFSAAGAAHYVGHELGHNMGSPHTHCYSPALDQCSTSGNNCYSGPTFCPASGSGTVMSYCHTRGDCRADDEFHPTVQARLENRLASQLTAGCIAPYTDPVNALIFDANFEN